MSQEINIFPATVEDLQSVVQIEETVFPSSHWSLKSFASCLNQADFWFWIAKLKNQVAGFLVCQVLDQEAELHNIAVVPSFQRQGVAQALLKELKEELKNKNVRELFLLVRASNLPAQRLYEKVDFKKVGERPKFYEKPVETAYIFCQTVDV